MSQGILVKVFEHSHQYFSLGIRLYFGTIPGTGVVGGAVGAGICSSTHAEDKGPRWSGSYRRISVVVWGGLREFRVSAYSTG